MTLPYESASSGDNAFKEMQRILEKFDCDNFGMQNSNADGVVRITFTHKSATINFEAFVESLCGFVA
ncbi:MAG: hypothetical protein U5K75_09380 [Ahrensia sp.]|nr:hypothetical protein [Ahrensia sp.]